ncbi:MAG: pathogenicity locus [Bacteroidetes bacterium]|nr:pathogenicity locus [Bacteroidota bacterium]
MKNRSHKESIKELKQIPGVGISIANDLWNIGITSINELKNKDPEVLYSTSNKFAGVTQDRCLLYVFKCAVYYAETPLQKRDPEKLKWWNWQDAPKPLKTSKKRKR